MEADLNALSTSDILETFQNTNQAVYETFLKEMMIVLRSSRSSGIQLSLTAAFNKQMSVIDDLGERVNHVEQKMGEFSKPHNRLVDAHNHLEDNLSSLVAKLADLEDRNRRNNMKFRGVPESVPPSELVLFVQQLIKSVLPSVTTHDLTIDRAHRLPEPKGLPESAPRDIIARIQFFHIKEDLMQITGKLKQQPEPFHKVKLFVDPSQYTIQACKRLALITLVLRQHNVMYRSGFPTNIINTRNGVTHIAKTLEEWTSVLKILGIDLPSSPASSSRPTKAKVAKDWSLVKGST